MWLASFVVTLAHATGWSEQVILDMPLARSMQYYHAAAQAQGGQTVATDDAVMDELQQIAIEVNDNGRD